MNAQLIKDTIYCDEMEFFYSSRAANTTATLAVIWGQSKPLDNPEKLHVLIYKCKEMADNCEMCHSLDEKYQCGWCQVYLCLPSICFCFCFCCARFAFFYFLFVGMIHILM